MLLAEQFLAEIGDQELFPPMHNSAPLVQSSGYTCERFFKGLYTKYTPFPLIISIKDNVGVMNLPITHIKGFTHEVFKKYWNSEPILAERNALYKKYAQDINEHYNTLNSQLLTTTDASTLVPDIQAMVDATWSLNASLAFTIYFDKEMCIQLLHAVDAHISDANLNEIWERAITPVGESFEKRRLAYIASLSAKGVPWKDIVQQCHYFVAGYHNVPTLEDANEILKEEYAHILNANDAKAELARLEQETQEAHTSFTRWYNTRNSEEQRLIDFIQFLIEMRDARKDNMAKSIAIVYRAAQQMFTLVNLPIDLVPYYTLYEMSKGMPYLTNHVEDIQKRTHGFTVYVTTDEQYFFEYGKHKKNRAIIDAHYLAQQHANTDTHTITGQTGAPGSVQGRAVIIRNISKEGHVFREGDILVTGMTRPEFVPLMKKASAVITDEGGITCHAAIVARELGIPCVIGTKTATHTLTTGDTVDVQATKGIVKILKKKKPLH